MVRLLSGTQLKEKQYVNFIFILDVLQSFDNDITSLAYVE